MTGRAGVEPRRDRRHRRVHRAVIGVRLASSMTGTISTTTSASRAAAAPSSVARSRPAAWASATSSATPGSSPTCDRPSLIDATTAGSMSTAMTDQPWRRELGGQRQAHLAGPDDGDGPGRARLAGPWRGPGAPARGGTGSAGRTIEPPSSEAPDGASGRSGSRRHQLDRAALAGGRQQRVGEDDRPAAVLGIDDRPPAVADDPDERLELGASGSPVATGSSTTSLSNVGA